jgi:hypothetical protein
MELGIYWLVKMGHLFTIEELCDGSGVSIQKNACFTRF